MISRIFSIMSAKFFDLDLPERLRRMDSTNGCSSASKDWTKFASIWNFSELAVVDDLHLVAVHRRGTCSTPGSQPDWKRRLRFERKLPSTKSSSMTLIASLSARRRTVSGGTTGTGRAGARVVDQRRHREEPDLAPWLSERVALLLAVALRL